MTRGISCFTACGLVCLLTGWTGAAKPIDPAQLEQVRNLVKPGDGEDKWTQIPWRTSLWEARRQAATQGKPILLWEMDGHPLGCT